MAKSKQPKFYVVWRGRQTGIFPTWEACKAQVHEFPGAEYKSFPTRAEAERAFGKPNADAPTAEPALPLHEESRVTLQQRQRWEQAGVVLDSYAVDAACQGNPGPTEYRGVHIATGELIFHQGPFAGGTNNVGEFLAIVHALAWMKQRAIEAPVYSDSKIAIGWVQWGRCNTRLLPTEENAPLFELLERAERWLAENDYPNEILKWQTKEWGEIPADYGRK